MSKLISLNIPGTGGSQVNIPAPPGFKFANDPSQQTLGYVISQFFQVFFYIAGFLLFFWLLWGVFQYIFAGGNKEALGKARQRITWAIFGFIFVAVSFLISQYAETIFPRHDKLTPVSIPIQNDKRGANSFCTEAVIRDCEALSSSSKTYKCAVIENEARCVER